MSVARLAELIQERQPCVVLTGAGISTESGIPDFRSAEGIWARVRPGRGRAHRRAPPRSFASLGVLRAPARSALARGAERRAPRPRRARRARLGAGRRDPEHRRAAPAGRLARGRRGARLGARGRVHPLRRPRADGGRRRLAPATAVPGLRRDPEAGRRDVRRAAAGTGDRAGAGARGGARVCSWSSARRSKCIRSPRCPGRRSPSGGALAIVNRGGTPWDAEAEVVLDAGAGQTLRGLAAALGMVGSDRPRRSDG